MLSNATWAFFLFSPGQVRYRRRSSRCCSRRRLLTTSFLFYIPFCLDFFLDGGNITFRSLTHGLPTLSITVDDFLPSTNIQLFRMTRFISATFVFTSILSILSNNVAALGLTDTITWGGDNSRAGYQTYVVAQKSIWTC